MTLSHLVDLIVDVAFPFYWLVYNLAKALSLSYYYNKSLIAVSILK